VISRLSRRSQQLVAAVVLSACVGVVGGGLAAWAIYARFGPVERVVTQTINVGGGGTASSAAGIGQQASPAIVEIATRSIGPQDLLGGTSGLADGFIVSSDGLVVTSIHAVHGATALNIATADGRLFPATIVRADPVHGIVALRAANAQGLTPLPFASQDPRPGDVVVAVGHSPFSPLTLSTGVVSSTGRPLALGDGEPVLADALTVDATPDPRQDGAPLLSGAGAVVGVVVDAAGSAPGVVALSGRAAADLVQSISSGSAPAPTLGAASIVVDAATAAAAGMPPGALVRTVAVGGPAAQAGLQPGDVVTSVSGTSIDSAHPFDAEALGLTPSQDVTVTFWRGGATQSVTLTVGAAGSASG